MFAKAFALLGLLVCLLLALRLALGPARRRRLDEGLRRLGSRLVRWAQRPLQRYRRRRMVRAAGVEAAELIRRAKAGDAGEWEGNVFRPKKFVRKSRKLH